MQHPPKAMTFQQIIMHVWQCPHDVDVHLLFLCHEELDDINHATEFNMHVCHAQSQKSIYILSTFTIL